MVTRVAAGAVVGVAAGAGVVVFGWKQALTTTSALTGLPGFFLVIMMITLRTCFLLLLMYAFSLGLTVCEVQKKYGFVKTFYSWYMICIENSSVKV